MTKTLKDYTEEELQKALEARRNTALVTNGYKFLYNYDAGKRENGKQLLPPREKTFLILMETDDHFLINTQYWKGLSNSYRDQRTVFQQHWKDFKETTKDHPEHASNIFTFIKVTDTRLYQAVAKGHTEQFKVAYENKSDALTHLVVDLGSKVCYNKKRLQTIEMQLSDARIHLEIALKSEGIINEQK